MGYQGKLSAFSSMRDMHALTKQVKITGRVGPLPALNFLRRCLNKIPLPLLPLPYRRAKNAASPFDSKGGECALRCNKATFILTNLGLLVYAKTIYELSRAGAWRLFAPFGIKGGSCVA